MHQEESPLLAVSKVITKENNCRWVKTKHIGYSLFKREIVQSFALIHIIICKIWKQLWVKLQCDFFTLSLITVDYSRCNPLQRQPRYYVRFKIHLYSRTLKHSQYNSLCCLMHKNTVYCSLHIWSIVARPLCISVTYNYGFRRLSSIMDLSSAWFDYGILDSYGNTKTLNLKVSHVWMNDL